MKTSIIAPCLHSSIDIEEIEIGARDKLDEDFKTFFDQNLCISCSDSNNTRVFNFYYASDDKLNIDSQFHIEREVQLVNKPLVCAIQLAPITLSKEQLQQVAMHNLILLGEKPPSGQIAIKTGHLLLKYTTASDNNSINVSAIEQAEEEPLYAYIISTLNSLFQLLTTAPRAVNSVGAILDKAANLNKPCFLTTGTLRVSGTINEQRNSFLFVVQDLSH